MVEREKSDGWLSTGVDISQVFSGRIEKFVVVQIPKSALRVPPGHHDEIGDHLPEAILRTGLTQFFEDSQQFSSLEVHHGSRSSTVG